MQSVMSYNKSARPIKIKQLLSVHGSGAWMHSRNGNNVRILGNCSVTYAEFERHDVYVSYV